MKGLATELATHGKLHEESSNGLLQALGYAACGDQPFASVEAYTIVMDCLGAMPNPRPSDVDRMLDPAYVPRGFLERGVVQWPRDPAECRARLQAILDREIAQLRIREETFRLEYEQPERAEAPIMALAKPSRDDMNLIRAERIHEQSYHQAVTALLKVRKQAAPAPRPAPPGRASRCFTSARSPFRPPCARQPRRPAAGWLPERCSDRSVRVLRHAIVTPAEPNRRSHQGPTSRDPILSKLERITLGLRTRRRRRVTSTKRERVNPSRCTRSRFVLVRSAWATQA